MRSAIKALIAAATAASAGLLAPASAQAPSDAYAWGSTFENEFDRATSWRAERRAAIDVARDAGLRLVSYADYDRGVWRIAGRDYRGGAIRVEVLAPEGCILSAYAPGRRIDPRASCATRYGPSAFE